MERMNRYDEKDKVLTRTQKNEDLYKDVYLNNTIVDLNQIMEQDENDTPTDDTKKSDEIIINKEMYEDTHYDLDEFLKEKSKLQKEDNLPRSLDEKIQEDANEISKIIERIEEKSKEEDFFEDLLPDTDNTIITSAPTYKLETVISDEAIDNFVMNKDLDETNSFIDIEDTTKISSPSIVQERRPKFKKKPFIVLVCSFVLLILVILYIIFRP